MRKWILLLLAGLLLAYLFTRREGFQDTDGIKGVYSLDGPDSATPHIGSSAEHVIKLMPNSLLKAIQNVKPKTNCPIAGDPMKQCPADPTTGAGMMTILSGDIATIMGDFYLNVYQPAVNPITTGDVDTYLTKYHMTPFLTANKDDVKALLVAYFVTQTAGAANTLNKSQRKSRDAASSRGYNAFDITDADNGSMAAAINERSSPGEAEMGNRPGTGPVFGDNGPFSGNAGTGQGTGMNAASTLTGSSYGHPPPSEGRLDPYDLWPGTKGSTSAKGFGLAVNGPPSGGMGEPQTTAAVTSQGGGPVLYGPSGQGEAPQKNSTDISGMPSWCSTGSEPNNRFAVTSRCPGSMDSIADTNFQADSYALSNVDPKTNPVPYLTDFSVFQK
jgi:hypothetical protein